MSSHFLDDGQRGIGDNHSYDAQRIPYETLVIRRDVCPRQQANDQCIDDVVKVESAVLPNSSRIQTVPLSKKRHLSILKSVFTVKKLTLKVAYKDDRKKHKEENHDHSNR